MAKHRKNTIDSFSGLFKGMENEQIEGQVNIETLENGKYLPEDIKKKEEPKTSGPKNAKRGRPKSNRELRKRFSFTMLPSLYQKASEKAYRQGRNVSDVISDLLTKYANEELD